MTFIPQRLSPLEEKAGGICLYLWNDPKILESQLKNKTKDQPEFTRWLPKALKEIAQGIHLESKKVTWKWERRSDHAFFGELICRQFFSFLQKHRTYIEDVRRSPRISEIVLRAFVEIGTIKKVLNLPTQAVFPQYLDDCTAILQRSLLDKIEASAKPKKPSKEAMISKLTFTNFNPRK